MIVINYIIVHFCSILSRKLNSSDSVIFASNIAIDIDVAAIFMIPESPLKMLTIGRTNIRLWRLRNGGTSIFWKHFVLKVT